MNLVFDSKLRDKLLFENSNYTLSRRYFWAYQVLKLMDKEIEDMITAYAQSLTDAVWKGEHKYIWPGVAEMGPKFRAWRQRMLSIRNDFEFEITQLQTLRHSNGRLQDSIDALRNQLFTGLALEESKLSVRDGNSIMVFTIVTIIFLPLSFFASVYVIWNNVGKSLTFQQVFGMNTAEIYSTPTSVIVRGIDWKTWLPTALILCSTVFFIALSISNSENYLRKFWVTSKNGVASAIWYAISKFSVSVGKLLGSKQGTLSKPDHPNNQDASKKHKRFDINSSEDEAWPQSVKEMWQDRRHSHAWYTFWIVVLVGSSTIAVGLLQLALSIAQLYAAYSQR